VSRFLENCAESSQVPSTGTRIIGKNTVLEPIPAIDADEHVSTPQVIPFMRKHHVIKISAGGDHSMAVCPAPVCNPVDTAQTQHDDVVWQVGEFLHSEATTTTPNPKP
jgi:alpha-tubulin suppressor-like RCC1 family protein